jgi:hypothetical protein
VVEEGVSDRSKLDLSRMGQTPKSPRRSRRPRSIDFKGAMHVPRAAFCGSHPPETVPQWIADTVTICGGHDDAHGPSPTEFFVFSTITLREGEH